MEKDNKKLKNVKMVLGSKKMITEPKNSDKIQKKLNKICMKGQLDMFGTVLDYSVIFSDFTENSFKFNHEAKNDCFIDSKDGVGKYSYISEIEYNFEYEDSETSFKGTLNIEKGILEGDTNQICGSKNGENGTFRVGMLIKIPEGKSIPLKKYINQNEQIEKIPIDEEKNPIYPYSTIGLVILTNNNGDKSYMTGTLIKGSVVLTYARGVKDAKKISFAMNFNGGINKKYFNVEKHFNFEGEDYAILILSENLEKSFGYIGIAYDHELGENSEYKLCGYPSTQNESELNLESMKISKKTFKEIDDKITYGNVAIRENFGSALWFKQDEDKYYVVAIHCGVNIENGNFISNQAIKITKTRFFKIKETLNRTTTRCKQPMPNIKH